jgi:peroxiredoxin Q/BCP
MLDLLKTLARRLRQPRGTGLLPPGTPAPDFELGDHLGQRHRLSDYRGRKVVLWFYPKAATPG